MSEEIAKWVFEQLPVECVLFGAFAFLILFALFIPYSIYGWIKEGREMRRFYSDDTPEKRKKRQEEHEGMQIARKFEAKWRSEKLYSSQQGYPENWNEISQRVRKRDGNKCGNCGNSHNLHVHHIVPISKGGTRNLNNLRTLCESCHKKLHHHMRD